MNTREKQAKLKPIYYAADIPKELKPTYAPFTPDWRPEQMRGLPRMLTQSLCGCHMHNAMNYQEWIMCPVHAAAPDMLRAMEVIAKMIEGKILKVSSDHKDSVNTVMQAVTGLLEATRKAKGEGQ